MEEALLYQKLKNNLARCETCEHFCVIKEGERGRCGVRENQSGRLRVINYGEIVAAHIDPVEKKPLYHFLPGTMTYSIAAAGCNFRCLHCQNYEISQDGKTQENKNTRKQEIKKTKKQVEAEELTPEQIVDLALTTNCPSISYTYTEPTIFVEFALTTMKLARQQGLKNIWVSNGYMSDKTLNLIIPYLDAINVDLKAFSEKFYAEICGAKLAPVLKNLIKIKKAGVHLEVTTLIIPTLNDSDEELTGLARWLKKNLGADTAWHVTAFYPTYKLLSLPPTAAATIFKAQKIGQAAGLKWVHAGNI